MYFLARFATPSHLPRRSHGNRVNYSANLLGGVKYQAQAQMDSIRKGVDFLERTAPTINLDVIMHEPPLFLQRYARDCA